MSSCQTVKTEAPRGFSHCVVSNDAIHLPRSSRGMDPANSRGSYSCGQVIAGVRWIKCPLASHHSYFREQGRKPS